MAEYTVTATSLNLRRGPAIELQNVITALPFGHIVDTLDQSSSRFWQIRTDLRGQTLHGYAAARYLAPASATPPPTVESSSISAVHFPRNPGSRLDSFGYRHCPLASAVTSWREPASPPAEKVATLHEIVRVLDVERSARYRPTSTATYCNIYAYDVCYFANAFLPRVWWTEKALLQLQAGVAQPVIYGKTVRELNANSLYNWLSEWGDDFGWQSTFDLDLLQDNVNEGKIGIISAQRQNLGRSGHIVAVLPELATHGADRAAGRVTAPLQSQAGALNKRYFATDWWVQRASEYRAVGFWYHD